ncbi:hypothetical protein [Prescottella agglutinans]|uniref:Uncharacterized protein n=1 Tax=Prescottella agglutinans TaxID=1644129 RepID=A0ABT6MG22_9NOCA|nr:hypothetical protein [Prescottella agglutinans]MDH6283238.1 hypothetical protein [Prescottella agglutinans]
MTSPGAPRPDGAYVVGTKFGQDVTEAGIRAQMRSKSLGGFGDAQNNLMGVDGILGGFANIVSAIFGTVNNTYVSELPVITNHRNGILALQDAFNQLILQGNSIVYTSPNTYHPSPGIVSIDVILIGGGGGGGSGAWNLIPANQFGGGGGGGGGEVHTTIPASMLPKNGDGSFKGIPIQMWPGGAGANSEDAPGSGGGDCIFGENDYLLKAGGGNGGSSGSTGGVSGAGGSGMILGGWGGHGAYIDGITATGGSSSTSAYDLHGGGGGGGGGGGAIFGTGGQGGISPGGQTQGAAGEAPSKVVATGGGGGAGAMRDTTVRGGQGAFPGGGGGGGGGGLTAPRVGRGGTGGNPIMFIIERMS